MHAWATAQAGPQFDERALARTQNEYGVDPFGFNLEYAMAAMAPVFWLYRNYHRVQTYGIDQVPEGRVLLVSNHSGQIPMDGMMIGSSMLLEARPPRAVRSMVEKWVPTLPYVSSFFARVGQVVGTPENCRRLLEADETILVFPEGVRGLTKTFDKRYQLQRFGLGFMRLALEARAPIVPVAVVGAEEQAPSLVDIKPLAKALGFPALPLTPWGLPIPLPTQYHIHFGAPLRFEGSADEDDSETQAKVEVVRETIQRMLNAGRAARTGVF